jgi:pimeloyl-ACP methyl ester carboxylesterase
MRSAKGRMPTDRDQFEAQLLRIDATQTGAIALGLREMRPSPGDRRLPPALLLHGATFGAALFDLPRSGYSLMAALAEAGRAVYALDVRGYGTSAGGLMDEVPEAHPPFAGVEEAVQDIEAAVSFVCRRCAMPTIDLVGFSWGTIAAARYAGGHPRTIRRLALYAPLFAEHNPSWLGRIADVSNRSRLAPAFGAYRLVTAASVIERWNNDLPGGDPGLFREEGVGELVFDTLAALDPRSGLQTPRAFRCPNGPLADLVQVFNGRPLYDPAKLTMPVLLIRGEHDTTSTATDAQRLLARLGSPVKRYRVIASGSHFLCIERNRAKLYDEFNDFLAPE